MKLVLDTNAYCLCDLGNESALQILETAASYFIPAIVYGELYYGFKHGNRFADNMRRLDKFIYNFGVSIIAVDTEVAKRFGDIYSALRQKGKPIPTNDIWIAASCAEVAGTLLTADSHFDEVAGLRITII